MAETVFLSSWKGLTPNLIHMLLGLWIVTNLNVETFGKNVTICFDVKHKGHRLESKPSIIAKINVTSEKDCIVECYKNRSLCQSVNYEKNATGRNCELLNTSYSEQRYNLRENASFDHYKLVESDKLTDRVQTSPKPKATPRQATENYTQRKTQEKVSSTKQTEPSTPKATTKLVSTTSPLSSPKETTRMLSTASTPATPIVTTEKNPATSADDEFSTEPPTTKATRKMVSATSPLSSSRETTRLLSTTTPSTSRVTTDKDSATSTSTSRATTERHSTTATTSTSRETSNNVFTETIPSTTKNATRNHSTTSTRSTPSGPGMVPSTSAPSTLKVTTEKKPATSAQCKEAALGMENMKISDSQITASTEYCEKYSTRKARLNGPGSWRAKQNDSDPWIEVDLSRNETITEIATQGSRWGSGLGSGTYGWVKTFFVSYSSDGKNFDFHKINGIIREFSGNYDQNSIVRNPLSPAVTARYIRLHPKTWYRNAAMRFELYGCTVNTIPCKAGEKTLGVEDNKKVKDSQLTSSSYWSTNHSAAYGRLYNYTGSWGWKAGVDNKKQWIQVDLGKKEVVTGISTQGGRYYQNYYRYCRVKSYSLKHSLNGTMFESYKDGGVVKISVGNNDYRTIVKNVLSPPITARYIRIHPVSWDRNICMRIELYGCY